MGNVLIVDVMYFICCETNLLLLLALFSMVADRENPLVLSILHASSSAYSHNPSDKIDEVSSLTLF